MPRLNNQRYWARYEFLHEALEVCPMLYAILPMQAQWGLHAYYQPSKQLSLAELIAHRQQVTQAQPTLAAYNLIEGAVPQ